MKTSSLLPALMLIAAPVALAQVVNDGATNTLSNVTNSFTGDVTVGTNGSFTLLVLSNNALLTNSVNGVIGLNTSAMSNEVRLISPTARWQIGSVLYLGSNGPFNRLVVSNGATLRDGAVGFLGLNATSSNNLALVTGPGSTWDAVQVWLGLNGPGNQLVVSNGGAVLDAYGYAGLNSTNNLAVVTGAGSIWSNTLDLQIGNSSAGNQLLVSNGGTVRNGLGYVGVNAGSSNNLAFITGAGSMWSNGLDLNIGYFSANNNQMFVSNGAAVFASGQGLIGQDGTANGNSVTVTDPGSLWWVGSNLYVGSNGAMSRLVVSNGATVEDFNGTLAFRAASSNNLALVTGSGSLWSNRSDLRIGNQGAGNQLIVSNGGWVADRYGYLSGFISSSNNFALISGNGSVWSNQFDLTVGVAGQSNRLVIEAGGLVACDNGLIGDFASSNHEVLVTGPGSLWTARTRVLLGNNATTASRLTVSNGAVVFNGINGAGGVGGRSNQLIVTGSGSLWTNQAYWLVGGSGNRVDVSNGGGLANADGTLGGGFGSTNNTLTLAGSGSMWNNSGNLKVGDGGDFNTFIASNGATVLSSNALIGASTSLGNNNFASVTGAGTLWSNRNDFTVGNYGTLNTLNVSGGAKVVTGGNCLLGANSGAGNNAAIVFDAGSSWLVGSSIYVGSNGPNSELVVDNGALVASQSAVIGFGASSFNNFAEVTGAASVWSNQFSVTVGQSASRNQLLVNAGGRVDSPVVDIGALSSSSNNYASVIGAGSLNTANLSVGVSGSGNQFAVTDSGTVTANGIVIVGFSNSSSNNRVTVDGGTLHATNATRTAVLDIRRGTNVLNAGLIDVDQLRLTNTHGFFEFNGGTLITRGAVVNNGMPFVMGQNDLIPAVWGAGATNHTLAGDLWLGYNTSFNQLFVTNAAALYVGGNPVLGFDIGSQSNTATVSGPGSLWSNAGVLYVGRSSSSGNQIVVSNGGTLYGGSPAFIGFTDPAISANSVTVTGPGSLWTNADYIMVGYQGTGHRLEVSDGGVVRSLRAEIGSTLAATQNVAVVTGSGSLWSNQTSLYVGDSSSGNRLVVSNSATVYVGSDAVLGINTNAYSNLALAVGGGTRLIANALYVGSNSALNRLVVSNGATVISRFAVIGQQTVAGPIGTNEVLVTDPGSAWTNQTGLNVGLSQFSRIVVSNAAVVDTGTGGIDGSACEATVTGPGSLWVNRQDLEIGSNGSGNRLVTTNGGTVVALGSVTLGASFGSTIDNRIIVDGGALRVTNATGTGYLNLLRGTNRLNAGVIEVDQWAAIGAQCLFEFFGGTFSAKNTFFNNSPFPTPVFRVGNGANSATFLLAGNGVHSFLSGGLFISTNASLIGNGLVEGVGVTVEPGGTLAPGTSIGKITFTNPPVLQGAVIMEISKNGSTITNDQIQVTTGTLTYGGSLTVSNLGPDTLAVGDSFRLFVAPSYAGGFSSLSLPALGPSLAWTNKLLVDGSIQVIAFPTDRFWTNTLGGSYEVAANWLSNIVAQPPDTANFTSNASYQVNWSADALAANAFFNAGSGTVTQAIGAASWSLTNSYVIGQNPTATAAVTHVSGTLLVTNSAGTAQFKVSAPGRGTFTLSGGQVIADSLLVTNVSKSIFAFNGGKLSVRNTTVNNAQLFRVGDGISAATLNLAGNGSHTFGSGLTLSANTSLTGNGSLKGGPVTVETGGQLSPGAGGSGPPFGNLQFISPPTLQGVTLMDVGRFGNNVSNDQITVTGTLTYGGSLAVTNIGSDALAGGEHFQLFNATSFAGSFSPITLPPLAPGLAWTNRLLLDGSLEVLPLLPAILISRGAYTQDFGSLSTSGPTVPWRDNFTLVGWYAAQTLAPFSINQYRISDGSDTTGGLYSFGSLGDADRALGSIASDTVGDLAYGLSFSNDTPASVTNFVITYSGEQWRSGNSATNTITFWYRVSAFGLTNPEPGAVTNWTSVTSLDFVSPNTSGSGTPLDGNALKNRRTNSAVHIPGLVLPPGQCLFFRWRDVNDFGQDQGMAVDDLAVSFSQVLPQITTIVANPTNGSVQVGGVGESNRTYEVEAATNLTPPIFWQLIASNIANSAGLFQFTDTNAPLFRVRFYRALVR